eukprot:TRINITY_DN45975_c0_g1_i1.p2 TRINITY_DN45975_c0_g1~~TRINITY_DN45975_c0_g1_i1.p2  ORF type:complete len:114 (+),score=28.84 TRINITY_DN45975_c0_g1_i1:292-633(+)
MEEAVGDQIQRSVLTAASVQVCEFQKAKDAEDAYWAEIEMRASGEAERPRGKGDDRRPGESVHDRLNRIETAARASLMLDRLKSRVCMAASIRGYAQQLDDEYWDEVEARAIS